MLVPGRVARKARQLRPAITSVNSKVTGQSRTITEGSSESGPSTPGTARTTRKLKILDPMMAPIAISLCPRNALTTEAASSGRLVPIATIVRPMINSDTPRLVAILTAPTTSIRLDAMSTASPIENDHQARPSGRSDVEVSAAAVASLADLARNTRKTARPMSNNRPSSFPRILSAMRTPTRSVIQTTCRSSRFTVCLSITMLVMQSVTPSTKPMLVMFEPRAFPTAREPASDSEAMIDTTISGAEVPRETMVIPISNGDRPPW